MSISNSNSSYDSSISSSESVADDFELFETIPSIPTGIHIVYNPQALSTYNKTSRYIPNIIEINENFSMPIHLHNPRKSYKGIDKKTLWYMACSSVRNTMHLVKDDSGENYQVHTCDPAINGDYFEFDKLDSTTNIIIMYIKPEGPVMSNKMKSFILCRDLHPHTLKQMRTKARRDEYEYNGDFFEYLNFQGEPCLYVDGLCSKERGVGKLLMGLLNTIVETSPHYKAIKLAALTYVVKYYYKLGYRFAHSPNPTFSKNKNVSTEVLTVANETVDKLPMISKDEEYKHSSWVEFINKLQQYKLFNTDFNTKIKRRQKQRMTRQTSYYDPITDTFVKHSDGYRRQKATKSHDLGANGWYMYKIFDTKDTSKREQTPPRRSLSRKRKVSLTPSIAKSKSKTRKRQKVKSKSKSKSKSKGKSKKSKSKKSKSKSKKSRSNSMSQ